MLTGNDASVRTLGKRWKTLQRGTYLAAVFTLAHWFLLEYELGPGLVHAAPVLVFRGWAALKR